jgi:sugar phosphate isomerase/epimerase
MTMEDFIRRAVELGLHGVDMTVYWMKSKDPAYLLSLRELAFRNGLPFSGTAIRASTVEADAQKRADILDDIKSWTDATALLGAPHMRIFAGKLPAGATLQQGIAWTVEIMKRACEYSAKRGVVLGLDVHAGITQRAADCLEILRQVDSPYAGINLDIGNFLGDTEDERLAQVEMCAPYATHTHIKHWYPAGGPAIDLDRVWRIFAKAGYKGYMSAEWEPHTKEDDCITGVPALVEEIKTLCRKYSTA